MIKTPEELTKEWKAGKLDVGFYYVKGVDGLFGVMSDYALYRVNLNHSDNEMTLLAPVPTYDEYKAMQAELAELKEKIKKREELIQCLGSNIDELDVKKSVLIIENNKLRGLLKECKEWFECFAWNKEYKHKSVNILARINAAIDESEKQ